MTELAEALGRTLLLMRDEFGAEVPEEVLLDALIGTRVALVCDAPNLASHPAQTAFITAALLMARSGHEVFLLAPNVPLLGPQPPLQQGALVDELCKVGLDLLPGISFKTGDPNGSVDIAIGFGNTPISMPARRRLWIDATAWSGTIRSCGDRSSTWPASLWPFGALAAAGLAANEVFKAAIQKVAPHALEPAATLARFENIDDFTFELAPSDTPFCRDLGGVDCVSGGAITNSILYCLARIPGATARGRIIEPETADCSNLNRYMLLRRSARGVGKAVDLAQTLRTTGLNFEALEMRYTQSLLSKTHSLAPNVIVGVDDIPARWAVQQANPKLLIVGATTHWSSMASFHVPNLGCAHCLHNRDEPGDGPIPTQAGVSFWAGLLAATYLARFAADQSVPPCEQQIYLTSFRPDRPFRAGVAIIQDCPTCGRTRKRA